MHGVKLFKPACKPGIREGLARGTTVAPAAFPFFKSVFTTSTTPAPAQGKAEPVAAAPQESTESPAQTPDMALRHMAKSLRLNEAGGRHIFLCSDQTKPKCCSRELGNQSWDYLKKRCKDLKLESGEVPLWRSKVNCLRVCVAGPIAVVYDMKAGQQVYYHSCTPPVLERILQEHIIGGQVVEEYRIRSE